MSKLPPPGTVTFANPNGTPSVGFQPNIGFSAESGDDDTAKLKHITVLNYLRNVVTFFVISFGLIYFWLWSDLHTENPIMAFLGVKANVGQEYATLSTKQSDLETELKDLTTKSKKIDEQIQTGKFLEFQTEIDEIRDTQLVWFDKISAETGETAYGMIDAFERITDFFASRSYSDPQKIISGNGNSRITIRDFTLNREGATISVEASQRFGRVFFLTNEFVSMMNSFPFYKDATIRNFSRSKDEIGDDMMTFSLKLKRQLPDEKDPYDERFAEYQKLFKR